MTRFTRSIVQIVAAFLFVSQLHAEEAPQAVLDLIPDLQTLGSDPALVAAVKEQNAEGLSLDTIKERDASWMATSGIDDFMNSLMNNEAAAALKAIENERGYIVESFLMDNQGANVAMSNKTSDYWQGDEAKFTESFKGGAGAVNIGDVKFDESTQEYIVQVSVPIMEGGKAIGALTLGISLDQLGE